MKMKRSLLLCLTLVVCASLAIGGTLAYLTDTDEEVNVFTMGNVDIEIDEVFDENTAKLDPGMEIQKEVKIENTGKNNAWVWYTYSIPADLDGALTLKFEDQTKWLYDQSFAPKAENVLIDGVLYNVYTVLYSEVLAADTETDVSLKSVMLNNNVDYRNGEYCVVQDGVVTPIGELSDKINVIINAYAIQEEGHTLETAYTNYYGQWGLPKSRTLADVSDTAGLKDALANGADYINVEAGTYTFPAASSFSGDEIIICEEGTVFKGNSKLNIKGATVVGATFDNPGGTAVDQTINGTFKDCTFTGSNALRWCYAGETVVFENCVFSGSLYGVHFDGGANDVIFKNCTISGFNAMAGAITKLTMEGCTFKSNGVSGYNGINLWGGVDMKDCTFVFDGSTTEWVDARGDNTTLTFTNCVVSDGTTERPLEASDVGDYGTGNTITIN